MTGAGRRVRRAGSAAAIAAPLLLTACGGDTPPPVQNFQALNYTYLTPLHLNVVGLDVVDHSTPAGPDDVASRSPVTPQQALTEMAHDRLFPGGSSGQAEFVIDNAVIERAPDGTLDGSMSVHLDVIGPGGNRVGYAEAHVSRHHAPPGEGEDRPAALYDLTKQMTADMNVEFEYQVRQSLGAFLQSDSVVPAPVQAQPLSSTPQSGTSQSGTPLLGAPLSGALVPAPGAAPLGSSPVPPGYLGGSAPGSSPPPGYPGGGASGAQQLSPQPTYLRPPGYQGPSPGAVGDPATGGYPSATPDPAAAAPVYQPPSTPTPNPDGPIPLAPPPS